MLVKNEFRLHFGSHKSLNSESKMEPSAECGNIGGSHVSVKLNLDLIPLGMKLVLVIRNYYSFRYEMDTGYCKLLFP